MTEYMKTMRKLVGHIPILQCGAGVIVENKAGEILLQLRKDNNCWGYPGGSIEIDEVVEDAAKRELFEETGIVASNLELFGVFSGKEMHYIYPNGDEVSNIAIVYICKDYAEELNAQQSEVIELKFFNIENLPKNLSPPDIKVIETYITSRTK